MPTLEQIAGVDTNDPAVRLAVDLARSDRAFLRKIVEERRKTGLSQADVAGRLGLTQPTIAAFERHDSDPKMSTIRRYAQVVGIMVAHQVERRWQLQVPFEAVSNKGSDPVVPTSSTQWTQTKATVKVSTDCGLAA